MLSKLKSLKWPGNKSSEDGAVGKAGSTKKSENTGSNQSGTQQVPASASSNADARAALKDPSEKKRLAAISQIKDVELLLSTALQDQSVAVKDSAAKQYSRQLSGGDETRSLISTYSNDADKRPLAIAITAHHKDVQIRDYGSSLFNEDSDLCSIALATRFHDTRLSVAQRLSSIEAIDKCWRGLKSKDKAVAKILKVRLDEQRDAEQLVQRQNQTTHKIIDEMERLATGTWSPNYTTRFELFDQQWQQLSFQPAAEAAEKYQALRQIAADKVAANKERQKKHDTCQAITDEVVQLRDSLFDSSADALTEKYQPARRLFNDCKARWQQAEKDFSSFKDLEQSYQQASRSATVQLKQASTVVAAINALNGRTDETNRATGATATQTGADVETASAARDATIIPAGADANSKAENSADTAASRKNSGDQSGRPKPERVTPNLDDEIKKLSALNDWFKTEAKEKTAYAAELPQLIAQLKKQATDQRESRVALQNAIGKQFSSLNSALASKRWGPARSIHERLASKISRLPESEKQRYQEKLSRLEVKLNELGDWKQFATEPKLVSLCEQMEKVPDQGLAPRDQADRIKDLQQQWKSMGASPALEKYWPRFKTAADTAFEPCAKYFAAKREEKNSKLKHRGDVCEMLEGYLEKSDWENAEWKLVEKTLRTAKAEWRNTRVFDRKASAELDQRFTSIVDAINEKLTPAYDAGAQEKADLIEKVKALTEGDVNQHCINQVKRLQGLWRRTGITRQKDDKKLWAEFNQLCSDIYSRHRDQQKEQYASSIQHVTRAKEIIRELKQMGKTDTTVDDKELQLLQDEFQSLPEFPERDSKYLLRDFGRAVDSVEAQIHKFGENSRSAELDRIAHNADICTMLEELIDQPPDLAKAESERLLESWDSGEKSDSAEWKKAMAQRRDSILGHLSANTQPDYEANTLQRRLLCIEAEILKDKDTPATDRDLRMQHQLKKLQTGDRGNINHSVAEETTNLKIAWLTALPASLADSAALEQRFNSALDL